MHDIFFFTDLHGQKDLFHAMYDWCMRQDPECTIVYGGDAADRGEYGYSIMKELLDLPNVIYIKGNHEDMFVKACDEIIGRSAIDDETYTQLHSKLPKEQAEEFIQTHHGEDVALACYNGGWPTLIDWVMDGADEEFVERIRELPYTIQYEKFDFCHSAYLPYAFEEVNAAEYNEEPVPQYSANALLWDRHSLNYGWTSGRYVFFGHTPTVHLHSKIHHGMSEQDIRPCAWQSLVPSDREKRDGWKIDMDTGATWTGRAYVINCLTLTVYGFYDNTVAHPDEEAQPFDEPFENYQII